MVCVVHVVCIQHWTSIKSHPETWVKIIKKHLRFIVLCFELVCDIFVYSKFFVNQNFCKPKVIYTTQVEDLFQSNTRFTKFHCVPSSMQ